MLKGPTTSSTASMSGTGRKVAGLARFDPLGGLRRNDKKPTVLHFVLPLWVKGEIEGGGVKPTGGSPYK